MLLNRLNLRLSRESSCRLAVFVVALAVGVSCAAPFTANLRPMREVDNVAVFALAGDRFPADPKLRKELPPVRRLPELSVDQVKALLGNIEYRKETLWGSLEGRVFYPRELDRVARLVAETIPKLGDQDRLVIISRHDPDTSVLSRGERVSVLVWADESSINVVFGDIRYEIPHNDYYELQDWTTILPINLKRAFPYQSIVASPSFQLKKVDGFTHETWAVFDAKVIPTLVYHSPERGRQTEYARRDFADRRRILRKMKDAGLVKPDEYDRRLEMISRDEKRYLLRDALESGLISRREYEEKTRELEPPAKGEPKGAKDEPGKGEPKSEEKGQPAKDEPSKGEPTKGEPTKGEPTKGEPTKSEPTKSEPKSEEE